MGKDLPSEGFVWLNEAEVRIHTPQQTLSMPTITADVLDSVLFDDINILSSDIHNNYKDNKKCSNICEENRCLQGNHETY